ncbi:MAG: DUF393 domain-containing protein [Bacteroidetes bacterium]|nr:DUF393 domain-containing protein [Bacteroidota bacterium]
MKHKDLKIVYDADCPMCNWYTGQFVKHGFLEKEGREPYQNIGPYTKTQIDMDRARNHIALWNKETGKVTYGYESLVEILSQRWQWIKTVATSKVVAPFISMLYDFISYNRKVIAPSAPRGFLNCIPDRNIKMRVVFLVICMFAVEYTAGMYFARYFSGVTRYADLPFRESILFLSQLLFQGVLAWFWNRNMVWDYLGNVAFISVLGGMMMVGFYLVLQFLPIDTNTLQILVGAGLGAVVMFMFLEHNRRIKIGNFNKNLSYSWVIFRILLFFIIFR